MNNRLFVGNLHYDLDEKDLMFFVHRNGFQVEEAVIVLDRETQRRRGFGFVTLKDGQEIQKAIAALNGQTLNGRKLTVNEAHPRKEKVQA